LSNWPAPRCWSASCRRWPCCAGGASAGVVRGRRLDHPPARALRSPGRARRRARVLACRAGRAGGQRRVGDIVIGKLGRYTAHWTYFNRPQRWLRGKRRCILCAGQSADSGPLGTSHYGSWTAENRLRARLDAAELAFAGGRWLVHGGVRRELAAAPADAGRPNFTGRCSRSPSGRTISACKPACPRNFSLAALREQIKLRRETRA